MKKVFSLVASLTLALLIGSHAVAADEIKIGAVLPLTGPIATFGQSSLNAVKMVIDEYNKKGGIRGKKLVLVETDSKGEPAEASNAVNKLIVSDKVVAIIGDIASSCTLAGAPIAQSSGIPMVTPGSTNVKVTEVGDYIFRTCFVDSFQGTVMSRFASKNLKIKKIATLTAISSDHSVGLRDVFTSNFKKLGGSVVAAESYSEGDQDFNAQLTKIKSSKAEAIYIPGYYTEAALIARQAKQLGLKIPLLGVDGWDSPKLFEIGGEAVVGSYFSNHYSADAKGKVAQTFLTNYKAKFKTLPDALAALGYDATKVLLEAIKKAPKEDPKLIRDALAKTKGIEGVTGSITLDAKRNPIKDVVVLKVGNGKGKYSYVTTVKP